MKDYFTLIRELKENKILSDADFRALLLSQNDDDKLFAEADAVRREIYGNKVYIRGLIEFTNYCKNNCFYCGIRRDNKKAERYRLTEEEILSCCKEGYGLGFRTFVLQGGEDGFFTDDIMCRIISHIKSDFPDCAVTLSVGEKSRGSYKAYFDAGADRYLLRHETADAGHYGKLHPGEMSLENRKKCLYDLKDIGFTVGSGFMVGSPFQTVDCIVKDLKFLAELQPDMIGIGPYITHGETPFRNFESGPLKLTLRLISVLRLMFPYALIPATTALGTIDKKGRESGLCAGANVVMPNLSPVRFRKLYDLYENKICTGEEAAQCRGCLEKRVESVGYEVVTDIGNPKKKAERQ